MVKKGFEDYLDSNDVVGEVVLLRGANDNAILIVEGPGDERFWRCFVNIDAVNIVIAHGRERAIDAMPGIRGVYEGVLCIVDRDFDHFCGRDASAADVVVTDEHDLEMMLVRSSALERLLIEEGSRKKLSALADAGKSTWELIEAPAHALGCLRLYSAEEGLGLRFEGLRYRFFDKRTLEFNVEEMIQEVFNHSQHHGEIEPCRQFIENWQTTPHPRHLMCCGHDVVVVLGRGLQSLLGSRPAGAVSPDEIECKLRLAYSPEEFRQSHVCAEVEKWEAANPKYRFLAAA